MSVWRTYRLRYFLIRLLAGRDLAVAINITVERDVTLKVDKPLYLHNVNRL